MISSLSEVTKQLNLHKSILIKVVLHWHEKKVYSFGWSSQVGPQISTQARCWHETQSIHSSEIKTLDHLYEEELSKIPQNCVRLISGNSTPLLEFPVKLNVFSKPLRVSRYWIHLSKLSKALTGSRFVRLLWTANHGFTCALAFITSALILAVCLRSSVGFGYIQCRCVRTRRTVATKRVLYVWVWACFERTDWSTLCSLSQNSNRWVTEVMKPEGLPKWPPRAEPSSRPAADLIDQPQGLVYESLTLRYVIVDPSTCSPFPHPAPPADRWQQTGNVWLGYAEQTLAATWRLDMAYICSPHQPASQHLTWGSLLSVSGPVAPSLSSPCLSALTVALLL